MQTLLRQGVSVSGNTLIGGRCYKCGTPLICPSCEASKRGKVKSKAKSKAARENGKLGGRPKVERPAPNKENE
jgi:uncharacterized Zn finger protein (UPF0148 family)